MHVIIMARKNPKKLRVDSNPVQFSMVERTNCLLKWKKMSAMRNRYKWTYVYVHYENGSIMFMALFRDNCFRQQMEKMP